MYPWYSLCGIHVMEFLRDLLLPKTFNRFSYVANVFWISFGGSLFAIFLDMEINESRRDFVCGSSGDSKELIRGMCWEQYKRQINKLEFLFMVSSLFPSVLLQVFG